ncbi:translation elongation factor Ts [Syntrophotalea carbinolica DSM 2380]|uniref:Elongation factor Ts n=1 Tax=Syntrophotalea carbinolica (strain DSM 2380 / NBRC 103641 / GraBd1) TaxID=338963 RepID=EFTS_SYNC1|nr:translation elongation factor Ts [Syntrophotalea carbinolica]Q3A396.1 RecName: Full=Elongation factor Ts; Short=EF-Ts [Syntrophotalea carbinolica DSM 2380]ABA89161.1 translation elongation factor Ts [Syntrophotalea carbinolica DSM 2380]
MKITASMVSELRTKTGAGMMDCKKALSEADGNIEEAVDILRKKGLSAAAKKADRAAAEGLVVGLNEGSCGVLVEVNAETDFVAKNANFQEFTNGVAKVVVSSKPADLEALKALPFPGTDRTVAEEQTHQIATIGENINLRRFVCFDVAQGAVAVYIHGVGKIGVLVELETSKGDDERVAALGRNLAMHIAAANPQYLNRDEVSAEVVEKEKEIMRTKALESGKPEKIVEKIIAGQINKYFGEVCLLEQAYVIDPDLTVTKVVENLGKEIGAEVTLSRYVRFQLGEGLEKRSDDFAAEVASMTK